MLHGLDIQISLGELGPHGCDVFMVDIGVEQECCEAIGAASHSAHQVDELVERSCARIFLRTAI
jgi:hypothetical protein